MEHSKLIKVKSNVAAKAYINKEQYVSMYKESIEYPDFFWKKQAQRLDWIKPFTKVRNARFCEDYQIKWFEDGELNICFNCVDRHLEKYANRVALIWEGDSPEESKKITYQDLYYEVVKFANVLKKLGVKKGDRVIIYMPMILEAAYAMLACSRIGAIHSVVFGGFSPESLRGRIEDCGAKIIITANEGVRGGKIVPLKNNVDIAVKDLNIQNILVVQRTNNKTNWNDKIDIWYHDIVKQVDGKICNPEKMNAEDPLFILYTSGSTGKPKGVVHSSAGYLLYASITHQYVFDYKDGEVYWCTADIGWVTGHSYVIYGPLSNAATSLMFEGVPNYPDYSRAWQIVDKHKVNIYYTAPTAIRAQMREGDEYVLKTSRKSLRILGSVGEPINPESWLWYYKIVGNSNCPIVDTWWQTETGGHMITPLPGAIDLKPGSATLPFFGIEAQLIDDKGNVVDGVSSGALCIANSWPGQMRTLYGDHKRFIDTYFSQYKGKYFTGDGANRDENGYYWITGRIDDVLNISGHRLGTAEIESALVSHDMVAEAAVVGYFHEIKGQGIYCFVTLKNGIKASDQLKQELILQVRKEIGAIATPDKIQWADGLPKTRSGKIMRRILRKIAENDYSNLGDTNTLLNPEVVEHLIANRL